VSTGNGPFTGRDAIAANLTGGEAGQFVRVETIHRTIHGTIVDGDLADLRHDAASGRQMGFRRSAPATRGAGSA
jgi:hypothetical protein